MSQLIQNRKTIKNSLNLRGIGLHSGKNVNLNIHPAESGSGLVFIPNSGSLKKFHIPVALDYVVDTSNAVTLGDGVNTIQTVEHILAAFHTRGITDALIEIDSLEIPIMDGSSLPFLDAISKNDLVVFPETVDPIFVKNPIWVVDGDKYLVILPSETLKITYHIDFKHPLLRGQSYTTEINETILESDILPARTFGFLRDVKALQERGLALGGSLDNAIVLSDEGYLNESLRFENECVRHKILDLIGDLSIVGRPIIGHILASKAGHALDISMGKLLLSKISGDEVSKFRSRRVYQNEKRKAWIGVG